MKRATLVRALFAMLVVCLSATAAQARTVLKNICRVKGQEEVTLHGLGLIVGLKGTGDGADALPTIRALARSMESMHMPIGAPTAKGQGGLRELKDAKNVALVMVTATVPAAGAQRGDKLECYVNAISAKSLAGGRLFMTPLLGPNIKSQRVYAIAQGQVELDDPQRVPTAAKIHKGCQLEVDFSSDFVEHGVITLVLDKDHADFQVAADVAELINTQLLNNLSSRGASIDSAKLARAIDQVRIEVPVPDAYLADESRRRSADLVSFVSEMLSLPIPEPQVEARVVINQRAGSVVINGDVEIGSVLVQHKGFAVEAGAVGPRFVAFDPDDRLLTPEEKAKKLPTTKLKSLLEALSAVKARPEDVIEIIKGIERNGKLHGKLIIE